MGRARSRGACPGRLVEWLGVLGLLAALAGCDRNSRLAQISAMQGPDRAVEAEHQGAWSPARPGMGLHSGDAVRTAADAWASLRFTSGREVRLSERSLIRLGVDAASSVHVTVELGQADIEGDGPLAVSTARGLARLDPGTRMSVKVAGGRSQYEVNFGRAVMGDGEDVLVLGSGDGVALQIGSAQVERYRIELGSPEVEPAPPPTPPVGNGVGADAGAAGAAGESVTGAAALATAGNRKPAAPTSFDVSLPAGESAIIHGRQTPLVIRLELQPPCPAGGSVILGYSGRAGRQRAEGRDQALFTVGSGSWSYRYQCERQELRRGTLTIRRDAGNERLPRVAPTNFIDADGRRYTVLYQSRLPSLTFGWPDAPPAPGYTLHVESKGRTRRYPVNAARLRLASGALSEGTYQWWFEAAAGKSSRRTTVTVRFDNAAVTAQVDTPRDGVRVTPGNEIEVAGVAIEGSTVAVGAAPLEVDEQGRFRGKARPPAANERSIAIRLAHPKSGVHYYVRRIVQ
jgi:FecR protein